MDFSQEQINKRYDSLPADLKAAIDSVEVGNIVAEIGYKNDLMLDQTAELMNQAAMVMLGIISPRKFSSNLVEFVEIDEKLANKISSEINDKVFNKIRFSLQKLQEQQEREEQPIESAVQNTTPAPAYIPPTPPQPPKPVFNRNPVINPNPVVNTSQTQPTTTVQIPTTQKPVETIGSTPLEKAGRFTLENPPIGVPNYTQVPISKKETLKEIEDLEANMVDHLLSTPVKNTENVEVKKPLIPKPVVDNQPYKTDPYREQI